MISKVKKRDGRTVDFDKEKIQKAILKAFREVDGHISFNSLGIANKIVEDIAINGKEEMEVEAIQNEIEKLLMDSPRADVAKAFIIYRNDRNRIRNKKSIIMKEAYELLEGKSEYWNTENSNKNPVLLSTQRDYMAGILSTEFTKAYLLDEDIVQAHEQGIIHFHDADYQAQRSISNCCLINLEDMLQNGTCINKVKIEKPHRLITATTIATQIITAVSSSQYGGATITLTHLAPFVRDSYNKHYAKYEKYGLDAYDCKKLAEIDTKKEIEDSVQTFNYQVNSMTTTNGQSPFLSVCMYLGETEEYKEELAMLIEEFLKQRLVGLKNEVGVYITQAFPKLLYVLEEDNIHEDSKYYYLTKLAAKCTAKRLVPDYISEKIMKEYKIDANGDGQCYPCMGCVDSQEVITYQYNGRVFTESFERMWNRMSNYFGIELQPNGKDYVMKTPGVLIFDQKKGFVDNYGIIKNHSSEWVKVTFSNGRVITCTPNHPFETVDGRIVLAGELTEADNIESDSDTKFKVEVKYPMNSSIVTSNICHATSIEKFSDNSFSYDVTTASEHFTVSGIYSHNCRSFLTPYVDENGKPKYYGRLTA